MCTLCFCDRPTAKKVEYEKDRWLIVFPCVLLTPFVIWSQQGVADSLFFETIDGMNGLDITG